MRHDLYLWLVFLIFFGVNSFGITSNEVNSRQSDPKVKIDIFKDWEQLLIKDETTARTLEENLRELLSMEKDVGVSGNTLEGLRYFMMAGGAWSGGGGLALICGYSLNQVFAHEERTTIDLNAYQSINEVNPFDYMSALANSMTLPIQSDTNSLEYLRRVLTTYYGEFAPLFVSQVLTLSTIIYNELQNQIKLFNPNSEFIKTQPLLLDYGDLSLSLFQRIQKNKNCDILQLATRYTKYQAFKLSPFSITFDIPAILRMKETSLTNNNYIAREASLILHEALYFLGSEIGVADASVISWGALPFFLSKTTQEQLQQISGRIEKSKWFRKKLKTFAMDRYNLLHLNQKYKKTQNKFQAELDEGAQEISQIMSEVETSNRKIINPIQARKSNSFNDELYELLKNKSSEATAFVVFITQIIDLETQKFVLDDLYLGEHDLEDVIHDFCNALMKSSLIKNSMKDKITKRAIQFCKNSNPQKTSFSILPKY